MSDIDIDINIDIDSGDDAAAPSPAVRQCVAGAASFTHAPIVKDFPDARYIPDVEELVAALTHPVADGDTLEVVNLEALCLLRARNRPTGMQETAAKVLDAEMSRVNEMFATGDRHADGTLTFTTTYRRNHTVGRVDGDWRSFRRFVA